MVITTLRTIFALPNLYLHYNAYLQVICKYPGKVLYLIVIPNSKLASVIIINYYLRGREIAVLVQVGVSYDSDLQKVERVTIEVGKEVMREAPRGVPEFELFIRYHTFADFSINFTVILRAKGFVDQYLIKHEFIKRLHQRFKEEEIEIPFPRRTVYLRENCQE